MLELWAKYTAVHSFSFFFFTGVTKAASKNNMLHITMVIYSIDVLIFPISTKFHMVFSKRMISSIKAILNKALNQGFCIKWVFVI